MLKLKRWARLGAAATLIGLGVAMLWQQEEFAPLLGLASICIGLGFLWHVWRAGE